MLVLLKEDWGISSREDTRGRKIGARVGVWISKEDAEAEVRLVR